MTIKVTYNVTDVYVTQDVSPVYINISYSSGGGSGAAVWGSITGTLSDQTDLQTALDGKFDDPTGTSLQYIDGTGALQTFPLTLPVLQEVRNQTGATLAAGTVVYINGATGNKPTVTKAIATGDATSAQTLGMVSAAIANNGTGYVVVIGTCSGLDTSAYTEGQQLYLSYTTAGAVTTTKPYAPNHLVYVGIVTRAHPTLGTVEVRVQNGYELDEIHDVDALNPNNNDGIFYNSTTSLWEHKQISTALGYTPANAATTLTINGVTYDLSTSRTWTISAGISGSGASGQVAYWDGTTSQAGSNNLFWDNANGRLGIGTNAPSYAVHVSRNVNGGEYIYINNSNTGTDAISGMWMQNDVGALTFQAFGSGFTPNPTTNVYPRSARFRSSLGMTNGMYFFTAGTAPLYFGTNDVPRIQVNGSTGNVLIQNGGTFTDGGQRLQVQGTTLLNGNVTFSSATGMTWDAANGRLGIGTNSPAQILDIRGTGVVVNKVTSSTNTGSALFQAQNNINSLYEFGVFGSTRSAFGAILSNNAYLYGSVDLAITSVGVIKFGTGITADERVRIFTTGNVLIQNGGTFTDTGERLQVTGTMKVTGNVAVDTNTLFVDTTNKRIGVRTATPGAGIDVWNNPSIENAQYRLSHSTLSIPSYSSVGFLPATTTNTAGLFALSSGSTGGVQFAGFTTNSATASPFIFVGYHGSTAPTVGAMRFLGFKHDGSTGRTALTGSEIIAGFAAGTGTDVFQVKANGRINMSSLPTSSTGLATGDLWNDAGTLKIV